jgi:hypothetical protein
MPLVSRTSSQSRQYAIGLGVSLAVICLYNALFFDRYLPLSEGWFSVYARYIVDGAVPYRDFHFFLPPVYPYMIAAFTEVFGESLIVLRLFGVAVTLSITGMLFLLYSRLFSSYVACIVTIVSVVYYQSDVTFIGYNFLNVLHLFALSGTVLICKYFDRDDSSFTSREGQKASVILLSAGSLFALAFLTKQSDGLFALLASFLAVAIAASGRGGLRRALSTLAVYSAGILLPMLILLIWLVSNGALSPFWDQVFHGASSSKGGIAAILFNWIPRLFTQANIGGLAVAVLAVIALRIYCLPRGFMLERARGSDQTMLSASKNRRVVLFLAILGLFVLCVLIPFWNVDISHDLYVNPFLNFVYYRILLVVGFTGSLLLLCVFVFKTVREKTRAYLDFAIISTLSLGILWGTGTSAAIGDMGMIMGLGLLLGCIFSIPSYSSVLKIACLILCAFLVLFLAARKYVEPYNWWGLDQPDVRVASTPLNVRYLEGFVVSEQTARIYSEVTAIVERDTEPGDSVYTFPNIPVFYLLTDRYPDTFGIVSWFDVEPDKFALDDARRIRESPPKVIIYLDVPEFVWQGHEEGFRGGEKSGQRMIVESIEYLTSNGSYELEATYDVPDGYTLRVWRMIS